MAYDRDRAGDFTLALMYLTLHDGARAWKGYDWDVMDHLFEKGFISDPRSRAKSVVLTEEGLARSEALFASLLARPDEAAPAAARTRSPRGRGGTDAAALPDAGLGEGPGWSTLPDGPRARARRLLSRLSEPSPDPGVRARLRIGCRFEGPAVLLYEARPHFEPPHQWREEPVAKFRYVKSRQVWQLFCMHRDLRWHVYHRLPESPDLSSLVAEVEQDPTGIFWG